MILGKRNIKLKFKTEFIKVRLSHCFIYSNESPLKMMKNAFYFILKALFVLKLFKFGLFGHVEKTT